MINIVLVEDQQILRESLESILNEVPDFHVQVSLSTATLLLETYKMYKPHLILMDICIQDESGIEATAMIKSEFPNAKVMLMTGMMDIGFVAAAKEAGADSFIYKNIALDQLVDSVKKTVLGMNIYPKDIQVHFPNNAQLTEKEILILRLVCMEYSRKDISKKLVMSEHTIRNYINKILDKTGYDNIARLAIYAIANGFINKTNEEELELIYGSFSCKDTE